MAGDIRVRPVRDIDRGLAWALAGFALYVGCGLVAIFGIAGFESAVLAPIGLGAEPGSTSWGLYLASHELAWGAAAAIAAAWVGRRLVPGLRIGAFAPLVVLIAGIALAAMTTFAVHEWVRARYEVFDPEYAGLVVFAAPALIALALGGWASLAMPLRLRRPAEVETVAAGAGFVLAALPTVGGLSDGVAASSGPLAVALALDGLFALGVVIALLLDHRRA